MSAERVDAKRDQIKALWAQLRETEAELAAAREQTETDGKAFAYIADQAEAGMDGLMPNQDFIRIRDRARAALAVRSQAGGKDGE